MNDFSCETSGFLQLKRELDAKSGGKLDFHVKKLGDLVATNSEGKYVLTDKEHASTSRIDVIRKYGRERRAYYINLATCTITNIFLALTNTASWPTIILPTVAWISLYSY